MQTLPDKKLFRISEAARWIGVHEDTIRRWIDAGRLDAVVLPSGGYRIVRETLLKIPENRKNILGCWGDD